ncbi:Methionine aminopeptidase [Photobacterium damselae subsp. piscicida]|uniref:Methionine aminopeptidase n=1 Tax=Photobacterium damsela subsp. piscicida TaxID=38294 RepID=A0A1V1V5T9_PHODP|nr:type I methionyl aminopeptidase [Photobacterium damselae]MBE8128501.1 type I methionyl aminopeptidase [Photobacterium damselae subsp. piscicida]PSV79078.1 type I methionyl aminopeptidase [Photobacterium damselae]PSW83784.1 type I methionyl aminopeptidase [Photobacterium damselae]QOD53205.1 type I methionyl aminopeptidase [Photobacterium damselae subsp. piscicida]QOD57044.1 type I methionyl aminopeptidase [Photobacterium damselae subsp. piscicida]
MSIKIKTAEEIEKMRVAGRLAAEVLKMIEPHVKAGVTTEELDRICHDYITKEQGAIPAPLNYHGYPKSVCTSINHIVCHGIPSEIDENMGSKYSKPAVLQDGDIINIDVTVIKDGYHGDTSRMFEVGEVSMEDKRLCRVAQESLYIGMKKVKPGATVGDIGTAIQKFIKNGTSRVSIVKDYCGHGIGDEFHEEPQVVHYKNNDRTVLKEGMCFTIEPMINAGKFGCVTDDDGWTVYTVDGKKSAQWEHTLLVTKDGCEVLTLRSDESIPRLMHN